MAPTNRNLQPATRGRPRRQTFDRREYTRRRRAADTRWRAEMAKYFHALRNLVPPSPSWRPDRRCVSKSEILDAAAGHVHYLEGVVSKLLEKKRRRNKRGPRDLKGVRDGFLNGRPACVKLPKASQRDRKFSVAEELVPSSEDAAVFTALRETPASSRADTFSASSSPSACDVWLNSGIDEVTCMLSPTMKGLMESFCENASDPAQGPRYGEVVRNERAVAEAALSPSGGQPEDLNLSGHSRTYAELNRAEVPVLLSAVVPSTSPSNQNQSPHSLREPWILDSKAWFSDDFY